MLGRMVNWRVENTGDEYRGVEAKIRQDRRRHDCDRERPRARSAVACLVQVLVGSYNVSCTAGRELCFVLIFITFRMSNCISGWTGRRRAQQALSIRSAAPSGASSAAPLGASSAAPSGASSAAPLGASSAAPLGASSVSLGLGVQPGESFQESVSLGSSALFQSEVLSPTQFDGLVHQGNQEGNQQLAASNLFPVFYDPNHFYGAVYATYCPCEFPNLVGL